MTQSAIQEFQWPEVDVLEQYVPPERIARIDSVLRQRLGSVAVLLEDVFDPHNTAACIRTCEGYGLQDVHIATNTYGLRVHSTVAKSADQWLDIHRYDASATAIKTLKEQGFALWVSDLSATHTLAELRLSDKIALVIGNAANGISDQMREAADVRYILPMYGMVQSFNLSVALAISLENIASRRRAELAGRGDLSPERMWALRRNWLEFGVKHADVMRRSLEEKGVRY